MQLDEFGRIPIGGAANPGCSVLHFGFRQFPRAARAVLGAATAGVRTDDAAAERVHRALLRECKMAFSAKAYDGDDDDTELSTGETFWLPVSKMNALKQPAVPAPAAASAAAAPSVSSARSTSSSHLPAVSPSSTNKRRAPARSLTLLERMAQEIFDLHAEPLRSADIPFDPDTSGAEWWALVLDQEDDVGFHWDKDYALEGDLGVNVHPHISTVTYLSGDVHARAQAQAPTVILRKRSPLFYGDDACGDVQEAMVSWPARGKHVSFDGRYLHGAPSDLATLMYPGSDLDVAAGNVGGGEGRRGKEERERELE